MQVKVPKQEQASKSYNTERSYNQACKPVNATYQRDHELDDGMVGDACDRAWGNSTYDGGRRAIGQAGAGRGEQKQT